MTLFEIDEFFREHPLKESYFKFSESERSGIAAVAQRDVAAAIANVPEIPENKQLLVNAAIAEQTVFLMLNPEYLTGTYTNISAVGSGDNLRRYSGQSSPLGQRAAALIAPLLNGTAVKSDGSGDAEDILPPTLSIIRG